MLTYSIFARFILVNYKQDLLGENTVDNTVDQKIALPFYVMLILHLVICHSSQLGPYSKKLDKTVRKIKPRRQKLK